jgi:hypothetical protein
MASLVQIHPHTCCGSVHFFLELYPAGPGHESVRSAIAVTREYSLPTRATKMPIAPLLIRIARLAQPAERIDGGDMAVHKQGIGLASVPRQM